MLLQYNYTLHGTDWVSTGLDQQSKVWQVRVRGETSTVKKRSRDQDPPPVWQHCSVSSSPPGLRALWELGTHLRHRAGQKALYHHIPSGQTPGVFGEFLALVFGKLSKRFFIFSEGFSSSLLPRWVHLRRQTPALFPVLPHGRNVSPPLCRNGIKGRYRSRPGRGRSSEAPSGSSRL